MTNFLPVTTTIEHLLDREGDESFVTTPVDTLELGEDGIIGGSTKHNGQFVPAGKRDKSFTRTGPDQQQIFNHRQISIIDDLSLLEIADGLEIDGDITDRYFGETRTMFVARRIGVNIVTGGFSDGRELHEIEPTYYLGETDHVGKFAVSMLVICYNDPCPIPGRAMASVYPGASESMGRKFEEVAAACRGFVGIVASTGVFTTGSQVTLEMKPKVPREKTN